MGRYASQLPPASRVPELSGARLAEQYQGVVEPLLNELGPVGLLTSWERTVLLSAAEEVICAPLQNAYACVQECCVAAEQAGERR